MTNDGGPAFPVTDSFAPPDPDTKVVHCRTVGGLTVRDYFAAAVLQGQQANTVGIQKFGEQKGDEFIAQLAKQAYRIADAMLAEREK